MNDPDEFEARELEPLQPEQQREAARAAMAEVRQEWDGLLEGIEGISLSGLEQEDDE